MLDYSKHPKRIQKFKETGDLNPIYKNEFDRAWLSDDVVYANSKELTKITISLQDFERYG